jgi:hypothetical protein
MDALRRKRAISSVEDIFAPSYDPTTDLDPGVASKINQLSPAARPQAIDQAYDQAGSFAKIKRMLMDAYKGDIYKKN